MNVIKWPHPTLALESKEVTAPLDPTLLGEMFDTMKFLGGVGLSAIQIAIPSRFFITTIGGSRRVFVNPSWYVPSQTIDANGLERVAMKEGCLSTPGQFATVMRYPGVIVRYQDENLQPQTDLLATGLLAQCVQHESEHLDGKMFVDHLKSAEKSRIKGAMMKLKRGGLR